MIGAVKDVVLYLLPSWGVAEQSSFFFYFFLLCSPANSTAVLPLMELLLAASHTVNNKLLFLKIGGAAGS